MNTDKLESYIKLIINGIKEGVVVNGVKRDFDLIDYYEITKLNLNKFFNLSSRYLNIDDLHLFRTFVLKYGKEKRIDDLDLDSKIFGPKFFVGVKFDEHGRVILNSGKEITLSEKEGIISYLKTNKIPVTFITYKLAVRRLINNEINLESNKISKSK